MKSTAFNLAFKVHRNEMPFAEGLLKSLDAEAEHDFIEALNSLAGEMRYDIEKLDALIEEAKQSLSPSQKPKYDLRALKDELNKLKKNRSELKESILALEGRVNSLRPTIIPGINAISIFMIGFVFGLILYLVGLGTIALLTVVSVLCGSIGSLVYDMSLLQKQQADIAQKKLRLANQIGEIQAQLEPLEETIREKEDFIRSVQPKAAAEPVNLPTDDEF